MLTMVLENLSSSYNTRRLVKIYEVCKKIQMFKNVSGFIMAQPQWRPVKKKIKKDNSTKFFVFKDLKALLAALPARL